MVDCPLNRGFRKDARRLLERCGGDEGIGRKRSLRDSQEQRSARGRLAALRNRPFVLLAEAELVDLLFQQERRIAHVFHLHPTHHLAHDHFNMLVVNRHALQAVDFLNFVYQVFLQLFFAQDRKNVMRIERPIHQRLSGAN